MQARDIMSTAPVTVGPDTKVRDIARLLLERRISGVLGTDADGKVLGIVSEGDLMRRPETGTLRHPSWWLSLLTSPEESAVAYVRSHGKTATDVMTRDVLSVNEDASLAEVAQLLETNRIKRVPVLRDGTLAGIISRADLLRALVAINPEPRARPDDRLVRAAIEQELQSAGVRSEYMNIVVANGNVDLWGAVRSPEELRAAEMVARSSEGVGEVRSHLSALPDIVQSTLGAE